VAELLSLHASNKPAIVPAVKGENGGTPISTQRTNHMPPQLEHPVRVPFFDLTAEEVDAQVESLGMPKFRGRQLRQWVYQKGVLDLERMTNLSKVDRLRLSDHFTFGSSSIVSHQISSDGTQKLLLAWPDGNNAETVMIPDGPRRTACVSSQVGCPVGCKFCASGINGVKGNLAPAQIVEQIIRLNLILSEAPTTKKAHGAAVGTEPDHITNIVFMGMGEPLSNYANLMQAIRVLHDPEGLNIGARKITVSTVGVPAKMRQLAEEELPINLAISLHAPTEPLRKQLIPWAEHFSLQDILSAARNYFHQTGREVTLEYILLAGVNDRPEHARQLAGLCKTLRANVNLIRYNEVAGLPFGRPQAEDVVNFQNILRNAGVNAHVRKSRGRDIDAACGQLRRKEQEKREQLVLLGTQS
jgi:23S rRNA (adenine2503-C2)-methyltransferase